MNKMTKLFALAVLSVMAGPSAVSADYSAATNPGTNPNYSQQMYSDPNLGSQYNQDTSGEQAYLRSSDARYNRFRQDDRNLMRQDRDFRDSYDPNAGYPSAQGGYYQGRYDAGQQFRNQGQFRGDRSFRGQGGRGSSFESGTPQSYPIEGSYQNIPHGSQFQQGQNFGPGNYSYNNPQHHGEGYDIGKVDPNDHHPVYEYMLGKDGQWRQVPANGNTNEFSWGDSASDPKKVKTDQSGQGTSQHPNTPRKDHQPAPKSDQSNPTSYYYNPSHSDDSDQAIGDVYRDSSSNLNRGSSTANQNWYNTDQGQDFNQTTYKPGRSSSAGAYPQR